MSVNIFFFWDLSSIKKDHLIALLFFVLCFWISDMLILQSFGINPVLSSSQKSTPSSAICPVCNKEMGYKSYLDRHMRTHTKIKPYPCKICGVSFTQQSSLNLHHRKFHDSFESSNRMITKVTSYDNIWSQCTYCKFCRDLILFWILL